MLSPMAPEYVLAVDFGQTWCKAACVATNGRFLATGRAPSRGLPGHGFGAADGERIWETFVAASREAMEGGRAEGLGAPAAIALSTRIGQGVLLDGENVPVEIPERARRIDDVTLDRLFLHTTWSGDTAGSYAPILAGRAMVVRRDHPILWRRVQRIGAFHDWLLLRLTGHWATNPATGPSALLWPPAVAALAGLPERALPAIHPFGEIVAPLTDAAATRLALTTRPPVVAGYHDGSAATLGVGALSDGDVCITLGTSVAIRAVRQGPLSGWFRYMVAPDRFAWMRGFEQALAYLDEAAAILVGEENAPPSRRGAFHRALTAEAHGAPPFPGGEASIRPLPPLASVPAHTRTARAGGAPRGLIYRRALEGLAAGIAGLAARAREAGLGPRRFIATGGGTENGLLIEILSALLGAPVEIADVEGGIRGAAIAAALGAGLHADLEVASAAMTPRWPEVVASPGMRRACAALAASIAPLPDPWEPRPYWRLLPT
ncbi:MAG: hypothetical protein FJ033_02255 [Chloroflexi bacterium]|nr:hypothetical protein [Chloroflexota bacterium]